MLKCPTLQQKKSAAKMAMACSAHFELQKSSSETYGWRHGHYVHFFLQSMLKLQSGTNNMQYLTAARCWQSTRCVHASRASLTKHCKLAWERNYKTAPMEGDIFVGDLLTMCKLKNTDATSHLHIDQRNIPSAAQFSVVANKEYTNKEATVRWKEPEAKKMKVC